MGAVLCPSAVSACVAGVWSVASGSLCRYGIKKNTVHLLQAVKVIELQVGCNAVMSYNKRKKNLDVVHNV